MKWAVARARMSRSRARANPPVEMRQARTSSSTEAAAIRTRTSARSRRGHGRRMGRAHCQSRTRRVDFRVAAQARASRTTADHHDFPSFRGSALGKSAGKRRNQGSRWNFAAAFTMG